MSVFFCSCFALLSYHFLKVLFVFEGIFKINFWRLSWSGVENMAFCCELWGNQAGAHPQWFHLYPFVVFRLDGSSIVSAAKWEGCLPLRNDRNSWSCGWLSFCCLRRLLLTSSQTRVLQLMYICTTSLRECCGERLSLKSQHSKSICVFFACSFHVGHVGHHTSMFGMLWRFAVFLPHQDLACHFTPCFTKILHIQYGWSYSSWPTH